MSTDEDRSAGLCVLGSISIHVDGRVVAMGGEKPRRLLAMLILHQNSVVSAERLMQALWEEDPPERALPTLQSYVSRLRRLLPPGARLVTQAPGYRLEVDPGITDVGRFESELADALEKLDGDPGAAVHRLDQALANWQGDAFAEFSGEWWARAEATRLEELRLHARETRVAALLALGQHDRAVSEAEALTMDHAWREQPWRALVLALHRSGRQGDALRRANQYRIHLREELGLEPSVEFVNLERDVALGAVHLAVPPAVSVAEREGRVPTAVVLERPSLHPRGVLTPPAGVRLIGRDDDLSNVIELCEQFPLVTLIGPGGVGKTQLALRVASEFVLRTGTPAEVVELARIRDEAAVVAAIATQLDVQAQQGRSVTESMLELLAHRPVLLVLDNCEHVLDAMAVFAERLLNACPQVRVLATSREPLGLPTETVYQVPSLAMAAEAADEGDQAASPAVTLFLQRARAANRDFVADEGTIRTVRELCRRLDGVPLAIELAAARTRSLSPQEIVERLGDRFALLTGSSRVSDPRHRSLRDLVDWSYQLLDPSAQQLFCRLSVFAGSFDLDAAEQVCGYGRIARASVASVLAALVDKSMVQATGGARTTYRLLETLRDYGATLVQAEGPELLERHTDWIVAICGRAEVGLYGADERIWLDLLDALFDDLRVTVLRAVDANDLATALRIVVSAREHAFRRLRYELIGWAETVLACEGAETQPLAAAAWGIVAYGRFVRGEFNGAIELGERSRELAIRRGTDTLGLAERALANAWVFRRDAARAQVAFEDMMAGAAASGVPARIAHACYMRSLSQTNAGDATAGMEYAQRAKQAATRCANPTALAQAAYAVGLWSAGTEPTRAMEELERSETLSREVGNLWLELFARTETLWLRAFRGEPLAALAGFAEVIAAWHRAGDWANQWLSLRHVLGICHLLGADELVAIIHGALELAGATDAFPFEPAAAANLANVVQEVRGRLGEPRFLAAEQQGRAAATTSAMIELITSQLARHAVGGRPSPPTEGD